MDLLPSSELNVGSLAWFRPELALSTGVLRPAGARPRLAARRPAAWPASPPPPWLVLARGRRPAGRRSRPGASALFNGMIASDGFATFFKWLFLAAGAVTVVMAALGSELAPARLGEFFALLLAVVLGLFLMASASDLLMMYLAIELVSMTSYVLAGFRKGDRRATEAALKYVIYGGVASGVMLFGMSYLYGLTGTFSFHELGPALARALDGSGAGPGRRPAGAGGRHRLRGRRRRATRSPPSRSTCGARTCTRAPPRPSPPSSRSGPKAAGFALALRFFALVFGAQDGGSAPARPRGRALAGGDRRGGGRHHDARQPGGHRPDQPQAAAGLLLHRPRRLHAHGARGRLGRRACRA